MHFPTISTNFESIHGFRVQNQKDMQKRPFFLNKHEILLYFLSTAHISQDFHSKSKKKIKNTHEQLDKLRQK